jgi:hypothetical protein
LPHDFDRFSAGARPAVQGAYIATGTDDPESNQNYLSVINRHSLLGDIRDDAVVSYVSVPEHMSDVKWLDANTLLAATGKGNLKLFNFDSNKRTLGLIGDMKEASGSYIRELAVHPSASHNIALGGFDEKLNILDLNRHENPYIQRLDLQGVIGTIKWMEINNTHCISCCLDEGKFYLFDPRTKITEASFYMNVKKEDLFTHEPINEFQLLLGFGDGMIKHIDLRTARVLHTKRDPYVEAIGCIEYNAQSNAMIVSGYTESVSNTRYCDT